MFHAWEIGMGRCVQTVVRTCVKKWSTRERLRFSRLNLNLRRCLRNLRRRSRERAVKRRKSSIQASIIFQMSSHFCDGLLLKFSTNDQVEWRGEGWTVHLFSCRVGMSRAKLPFQWTTSRYVLVSVVRGCGGQLEGICLFCKYKRWIYKTSCNQSDG